MTHSPSYCLQESSPGYAHEEMFRVPSYDSDELWQCAWPALLTLQIQTSRRQAMHSAQRSDLGISALIQREPSPYILHATTIIAFARLKIFHYLLDASTPIPSHTALYCILLLHRKLIHWVAAFTPHTENARDHLPVQSPGCQQMSPRPDGIAPDGNCLV